MPSVVSLSVHTCASKKPTPITSGADSALLWSQSTSSFAGICSSCGGTCFPTTFYNQQLCGKFGQVTAGSVISKEPLLASMGRTLQPSPHKSYPRWKKTRQSTDTCSKRGSCIANNGVLNTESTLHLTSWTCFWYFRTDATVNFLGGRVVWSRIENHIVQCIKKTNKQVYRHTPLIGAGIV